MASRSKDNFSLDSPFIEQIVGRERREGLSQLAWCGGGCFDSRRRVNSTVVRLLSLTFVLIIIALVGDPMSLFAQSTSTQKFDSYGELPTDDEAARLDAFREELRTHPNLLGYLIGYSPNTVSRGACLRTLYVGQR